MSIYTLKLIAFAVLVAAALHGCGKQSSSSGNASADVASCKGEVERAVHLPGLSEPEAYRAGELALENCMKRKGY